jgi:hypothetical protein
LSSSKKALQRDKITLSARLKATGAANFRAFCPPSGWDHRNAAIPIALVQKIRQVRALGSIAQLWHTPFP